MLPLRKGATDDNPADFVDKASREFELNAQLMMKERKRALIQELQGAIMRIDRGYSGFVRFVKAGYRKEGCSQYPRAVLA